MDYTTIAIAVVGLLATGIVLTFSVRYFRNTNKNSNNDNSNTVVQQKNKVGGDMAGRDLKK
jgi:hypothetical protein